MESSESLPEIIASLGEIYTVIDSARRSRVNMQRTLRRLECQHLRLDVLAQTEYMTPEKIEQIKSALEHSATLQRIITEWLELCTFGDKPHGGRSARDQAWDTLISELYILCDELSLDHLTHAELEDAHSKLTKLQTGWNAQGIARQSLASEYKRTMREYKQMMVLVSIPNLKTENGDV